MGEKLHTSKPYIDDISIENVVDVLKTGNISQGCIVKDLEDKFSRYCKTRFGIAVNSGTAGLHSALHAAGIGKGDEVIVSPFTFIATGTSILMTGASPVFVDIDPGTFNIDPSLIEEKISQRTRVIMPVHLYGLLSDMEKINQIAKIHDLIIIEDACQAAGASYKGRMAGSFGDMGVFSFYASKNITTAEGGMVITDNAEYDKMIRRFRHHGQEQNDDYDCIDLGYNYRMTDVHAAISLRQLDLLNDLNKKRKGNASLLNKGLAGIRGIITPIVPEGYEHSYHQYTVMINEREFGCTRKVLIEELNRNGIYPRIYYPKPLHLTKLFKRAGNLTDNFNIAEESAKKVLSLPVHPLVEAKDIEKIINTIMNKSKNHV